MCISFFLSLLAIMVSRASGEMDLSMCENLLKAQVDSLDHQKYMKVDLDEVVEEFEGFLMAAYAMVDRMNVKLIEKAVKEIFGVQHAQACAQRLAAAFAHLRKKEARMTTGAKLHPAVKRIIVAKACKRPAAAMSEDKAEVEDNNLDEDDGDDKSDPSEEMQEEPPSHEMEEEPPSHGDGKPADVPPEPIVRKYGKMYYKNGHAYGIRRKFLGNNQAFQVGGTACKLSPAQLSTIADETIRKMEEEDLEEGLALLWAKEEMKRVS